MKSFLFGAMLGQLVVLSMYPSSDGVILLVMTMILFCLVKSTPKVTK